MKGIVVNFEGFEIEDTRAGGVFSFKEEAFNRVKVIIIKEGGDLVKADKDRFKEGGRGGIKELRAGDEM